MGEIIESTRRHYVGVDADKDSIPAGGKAFGDSYHANDKGKQYYWNGAAWKTGLGYEYVDRLAGGYDKVLVDFVTDGTWKVDGLDLSAVVPVGAVAVVLAVDIKDDAADTYLLIRRDAVNSFNTLNTKTHAANISVYKTSQISIDSDRKLDYNGSNLVFTTINITVVGWFT